MQRSTNVGRGELECDGRGVYERLHIDVARIGVVPDEETVDQFG